jgi:hypothetical protein
VQVWKSRSEQVFPVPCSRARNRFSLGFNVLPRGLSSRIQKQTLGLHIHGPLVFGWEGSTSRWLDCVYIWWRQELPNNMATDVNLALSNIHPHQSSLFKSHRGCAYAVSEVYPIVDVGQMSRNGKEDEMRSVTAEEGGVHECVTDGYSS